MTGMRPQAPKIPSKARLYDALFEAALEGIILIDDRGAILSCNPAAERMFGYSDGEALGLKLYELIAPADAQQVGQGELSVFAHAGNGGIFKRSQELKASRRDGTEIDVGLSIAPMKIENKWYAVGIVRDISAAKRLETALHDAKDRAEQYFNSTGAVMLALDCSGQVRAINSAGLDLLKAEADQVVGRDWFEHFLPADSRATTRNLFDALTTGRIVQTRQQINEVRCNDGSKRAVSWNHQVLRRPDGSIEGTLSAGADVSTELRLQEQLQISQENFFNVVHKNRSGIAIVGMDGIVLFANPVAETLIGRPGRDLVGTELGVPSVERFTEMDILRADKTRGTAEMTAAETIWQGERAYLVMLHDITERKKAEAQIRHLAYHDPLTGLPNRVLFLERLRDGLRRRRRNANLIGLLFIDLNRFKEVNDTLGHDAGDQLLKVVTQRLSGCLRDMDTVARIGGDEFTVILEQLKAASDARLIADKIQRALSLPLTIDESPVSISASIGIAVAPDDGDESDLLLRHADDAMYAAKHSAKVEVVAYSPEIYRIKPGREQLERALRGVLLRQELSLEYQPQYRISDGALIGLEALLRWNHPKLGRVAPDYFIPIMEETGLILDVGRWVLQQACDQIAAWLDAGLPMVPVAVNVSPLQLSDPGFPDLLFEMMLARGLPVGSLGLELTESAVMDDLDSAVKTLNRLTHRGVALHMDDFGTGYSSLGMLRRLPFDTVKIDRSFVTDLSEDHDDAMLTSGIITMAHSLNKTVVAEGVETRAQLALLREFGCDFAQGWLCGRPANADNTEHLLRNPDSVACVGT